MHLTLAPSQLGAIRSVPKHMHPAAMYLYNLHKHSCTSVSQGAIALDNSLQYYACPHPMFTHLAAQLPTAAIGSSVGVAGICSAGGLEEASDRRREPKVFRLTPEGEGRGLCDRRYLPHSNHAEQPQTNEPEWAKNPVAGSQGWKRRCFGSVRADKIHLAGPSKRLAEGLSNRPALLAAWSPTQKTKSNSQACDVVLTGKTNSFFRCGHYAAQLGTHGPLSTVKLAMPRGRTERVQREQLLQRVDPKTLLTWWRPGAWSRGCARSWAACAPTR